MNITRNIFTALIFTFFSISSFPQEVTFSDVSFFMGLTHNPQYTRGGVSLFDFNGDGLEDYSFGSGIDQPVFIFKNNQNSFLNITESLNLNVNNLTRTVLWVDYDNDGDKDLFIGNDGATNRLFNNDGNFVFSDVTLTAGLDTSENTTNSAAWADYNNDGWLDLYVANYSEFQTNVLYKNNGDGTFTDVTEIAGVSDKIEGEEYYRLPFVVTFFDYNNDGWQDIYLANDHNTRNTLFKNNGDGTFTDVSESSGTGFIGFMMGIAIGDYDNNGYLDIYSSNDPPGNALLKNNGDGTFTNVALDLGVGVHKSCWGISFFDYDNDTDLDLYVCVESGSGDKRNPLFRNNGDGTFDRITDIGLEHDNVSYGSSVGDYNNDGFPDLAVYNNQVKNNLYKNSGNDNNYIKILLEGTESNRDGVGSRIELFIDGQKFIRSTHIGESYCSQNSNIYTYGVGTAEVIDSIKIKWSLGIIDKYYNVEVNQLINAVEGETLTSIENDINNPLEFKLLQNYPNPFNPVTNIRYEVSTRQFVTLKIYDVLGNEITTIVNEEKSPGIYNIKFDSGKQQLSSGIYFYRLTSGNFISTKKMILLQ